MDQRPTLARLRKLLATRDLAEIEQAVEIALSLDDHALFDTLLDGVAWAETVVHQQPVGVIQPGSFFTADTKPAQRFNDHALRLLLARLPESYPRGAALRESILHLTLHAVDVYPYQPIDLTPLGAFKNLKRLTLRGVSSVTGFEALASLPGLESVLLQSGNFPDGFDGLAGSASLRALTLSGAFQRIGDLGEGPSLTSLDIPWASGLASLAGLERLTAIESLRVNANSQIASLAPLARIRTLKKLSLNLTNDALDSLRGIEANTGLQELEVTAPIRSLDALAGMRSLRVLGLQHCRKLTSLGALAGCATLKRVDVSMTAVETLDGLEASALDEFNASHCSALRSLKGLSGTRALQHLHWRGMSALESLDGMENLSALEHLHLDFVGKLQHVSALKNLHSLRSIELEGAGSLASLDGLQGARALTSLRITEASALTDLSALRGLPALKTVYLVGATKLTDVSALATLPALEILDLWGAASLEDVTSLASAPALKALSLGGSKVERNKIDERVRKVTTYAADRDLAALAARGPIERHGAHVPEAITKDIKKHYQRLKKLLLARDNALVDQGVELAVSLDEPGIFEGLINGVTWDRNLRRSAIRPEVPIVPGGMFKPNEVLDVTGPAAPYRDRALLGLMFHAPATCETAQALKQEVTALELDGTTAARKSTPVDVGPLTMFPKLEGLTITSAESVENFDKVAELTGLRTLALLYTTAGDLSALREHPALEHLCVANHWHAAGKTLQGIERLPQLKTLFVTGGAQPGTATLRALPSLTTVRVRSVQQLDEVILKDAPALESLEFSSCQQLRAVELSGCDGVTSLTLNYCPRLQSLRGLGGMSHLRTVVITSALEVPFAPGELAGLTSLTSLTFTSCASLIDLTWLAALPSLEKLSLTYCQNVTHLSPLTSLPRLTHLDIQGCQKVTDLSALGSMPHLKQVIARHSGVNLKALTGRLAKIAR